MKICKIILILFITAAIGWFGFRFGYPIKHAQADVYQQLLHFTQAMPDYLFQENKTSGPRKIMFNGLTTHMSVGKTTDTIEQVLDFYEKKYAQQPEIMFDEDLEGEWLRDDLIEIEARSNLTDSHLRIEGEDYGLWATFEVNEELSKRIDEEGADALSDDLSRGAIGKAATGRVVMVLKEEKSNTSRIITLWTDRDFNLTNLTPNAFGDTAGRDIEEIPRYPNSKRTLCVEQENSDTQDTMIVYEGPGTIAAVVLFYRSRMTGAGWNENRTFKQQAREQSLENVLFFYRNSRECTLQINRNKETGKTITTVIERRNT
ncbi:MAG: hypothetical protein GY868_06565 [Deltaproteobacteria bacterium]|nr:hypothetical protein [Deltaproteobacteria bacterium]